MTHIALPQAGQLQEALEKLLALEKQARNVRFCYILDISYNLIACIFILSSGLGSEVNDATRRSNNRARVRRTRVCAAQLEHKRLEQETRSIERRDSGYGRASHDMAG